MSFAADPDESLPSNPRWDSDFVDRCLVDLMQHWGHWRRLGLLYAAKVPSFERCCAVREAVDWGKRLGMLIEGDRRRGYRIVGFKHPERVYLVRPGRRPDNVGDAEVSGQLTLAECVAVE